MTGFAAVEGFFADGATFALAVKSVNHRFLDLHLRLPHGCEALEVELRRLAKERVGRGHVEISLELGRPTATAGVQVNGPLLEALAAAWRETAQRMGLPGEPEMGVLLRVPGVLTTETRGQRVPAEELLRVVVPAATEAMAEMNAARAREGEALARELRVGMERLMGASAVLSELRAGVQQAQFARLRERLRELLDGAAVGEERLLTEAGLLTEKSDVAEEAVRLRTHAERVVATLEEGGAVGKALDFLLQELNREANTTLAKTGSAAGPESLRMTELRLLMKTEIERAREQVQNLE